MAYWVGGRRFTFWILVFCAGAYNSSSILPHWATRGVIAPEFLGEPILGVAPPLEVAPL